MVRQLSRAALASLLAAFLAAAPVVQAQQAAAAPAQTSASSESASNGPADPWPRRLETKQGTFLIYQPQLDKKVAAMKRRCDELRRDFDTLEVSQQCTVVIAPDEASAREQLEKAKKIYGGHMGGALEEHGIWGAPEQVIERIQRHVALGVSLFVIEFFGRDTREPARLFAEKVAPAFGDV